jgi:hypothetical protein
MSRFVNIDDEKINDILSKKCLKTKIVTKFVISKFFLVEYKF